MLEFFVLEKCKLMFGYTNCKNASISTKQKEYIEEVWFQGFIP